MGRRDVRNLLFVVIAAAMCFGGTFVCTSHHDGDDSQSGGFVVINP